MLTRCPGDAREGTHGVGVAVVVLGVAEGLHKGERGVVVVKGADVVGGCRAVGVQQRLQAGDRLQRRTTPHVSFLAHDSLSKSSHAHMHGPAAPHTHPCHVRATV